MSRSARAAKGFAASIVQFCTQALLQVLLAPIVLRFAGRETLGAFAAIMQTIGFLYMFDVVGDWSLERFLAQATGREDGGSRFRVLFTTARTFYWIINSFFAIATLIFSVFIGRIFHLSPAVALQARHALYVIALWSLVRVPLAAYSVAMIATQDIAAANMISALGSALRVLASLGYVLAGGGLFGLMLAGTSAEAVSLVLYRMRFRKTHPELMPGWGISDKPLLREMLGFGVHAAILNVGNMFCLNSGSAVAGLTSGAAMASNFYTTQMPTMTAYSMLGRLNESVTPALNELFGRGEVGRMRNAFVRITRVQLLLGFPLGAGVLMFNRDLVTAWVGPSQYAGNLLTIFLSIYCVMNGLQGVVLRYSYVLGWMRLLAVTSILQGLATFGLGLYLGRKIGLGGIALALVISVLPQMLLLIQRLSRYLDLNIARLLAACALKAAVPLVVASAAGLIAHSWFPTSVHHFGGLIIEVMSFLIAYFTLAYFIYMENQDRSDLKGLVVETLRQSRGVGTRVSRALGVVG
jgi:O-antigen/teichoic acid export membrane protein